MARTHRRARGAPLWLRETHSRALHGICGRFARQRLSGDLTDAQEWLWDQCIAELEYRRRTARPVWASCSCMFCVPPFPPIAAYDDAE